MELDEIDALRASVEVLRGTNDQMIDEIGRRTGVRLEDRPVAAKRSPVGGAAHEPRHIDDVLADGGEVAGTGFVIPRDPPNTAPRPSTS